MRLDCLRRRPVALGGLIVLAGCVAQTPEGDGSGGGDGHSRTKSEPGKADSSAEAVFLDFELDGELLASSSVNPEKQIESQLMYTVGQLNGDNSVGRLDKVELSDVRTEPQGGRTRITYRARMPVAWGKRNAVPERYTFQLPHDVSRDGLQQFMDEYGHDCVSYSAHDVDSGILWYYYRPARHGCTLASEHIVELEAAVSPSPIQTTGKFPEYHKVWEDDAFNVVAIFGKYEEGATSNTDAGIRAYNRFVDAVADLLRPHHLTTEPTDYPSNPGVETPEIVFEGTLAEGREIVVHTILIDGVRTASFDFDRRYEQLTPTADLIVYNGHSGLGANIEALAQKGRWAEGQYSIVFMNGCDTYAYVSSALADAHAAVNPDDPNGTKYMDLVTNAMPSFFRSMPYATMALIEGLLDYEEPRTYEQIFQEVDSAQVVLVSGEQDNEFVPGDDDGEGPTDGWEGFAHAGTVARGDEARYHTPRLAPGRYRFELRGSGDADLYVRIGTEPTQRLYDCRPYLDGSDERCEVELGAEAPIHVMVRGYAAHSEFELAGGPAPR